GPNGLPAVSTAITIDGNGSTITRSNAAPPFRLFYVAAAAPLSTLTRGSLTLRNLVLWACAWIRAQGARAGAPRSARRQADTDRRWTNRPEPERARPSHVRPSV